MLLKVDDWPVIGEYDVVVVGAGPAGIGAAVAASRAGCSTAVIEKYGFPGGVSTIAFCPFLMGFAYGDRQIVGGVADELVRELDRLGQAAFVVDPAHIADNKPIGNRPILDNVITSVEGIRIAANNLFERAGVVRKYYTTLIGSIVEDNRVAAVAVDTVDGPGLIRGKAFVDATGDANLVWRSGGKVREYPVEESMTKSILFRVGGVYNFNVKLIKERYNQLVEAGEVPFPAQTRFMGIGMLNPGEVMLNFTLTAGNALSADDLTRMDIELRKQILVIVDWLRRYIPEFSQCYLIDAGSGVGVRAGRGIVGHETITTDDLDNNIPVEEPVALGHRSYGGHGINSFEPAWKKDNPGIRPIPWRALIPVSFENVSVGGRAISCDVKVIDTVRLMARCMATGQAAGVSAALAVKEKKRIIDLAYSSVREILIEQHAVLM